MRMARHPLKVLRMQRRQPENEDKRGAEVENDAPYDLDLAPTHAL
jgi:hypothetical protein